MGLRLDGLSTLGVWRSRKSYEIKEVVGSLQAED
jgi:hypothetical protein